MRPENSDRNFEISRPPIEPIKFIGGDFVSHPSRAVRVDLPQPINLLDRSDGDVIANLRINHAAPSPWSELFEAAGALSEQIRCFAKTSEPDFAAIDFPAFFRVDLSGSMAAPSI
jgi:hypothetical protein